MYNMLHPGKVGIAGRWCAVFPALVVAQQLPAPITDVKWWVGYDIVRLEIWQLLVTPRVALSDICTDTSTRRIHLAHAPGSLP